MLFVSSICIDWFFLRRFKINKESQRKIYFIYIGSQFMILQYFKMKNINLSILILTLAYSVSSIYIGLSQKELCMHIEEDRGKVYKFFYEVNGANPEALEVNILPQNGVGSVKLLGSKNQTIFGADQTTKVCFISTDKKYKSVSVDFYTHDKAHLLELAKKSEIYQLHDKLMSVGDTLKEIARNQLFQEQRQDFHTKLITEGQNTIKSFAVLKIIAIVVVAVGQLFLLRKMLSKSSKGYQPV